MCLGGVAFETLTAARSGRVVAIFERSFYADFGGRYVCFGVEQIGNGPLNVLVPASSPSTW